MKVVSNNRIHVQGERFLNKRNGDIKQPYAIVIGLNGMVGLQTARILANHGVPVISIANDPKHHISLTKVCEEILFANTDNEEFIELLKVLGPTLNRKAVLYPCGDRNVALLSRNRQSLGKWFQIILPDPDIVEKLMDKVSFYDFAKKEGYPIPRSYFLKNRRDVERASRELNFPCVLKPPARSSEWDENSNFKVHWVTSAEELLYLFENYIDRIKTLIVQEWISGPDSNLYSCNCYFDSSSTPLVTFIARKLRQWPPQRGVSSLGEECNNPIVLNQTLQLLQSVNYKGLGYLEMKVDDRSGKYFIMEANIGRPTGRSAIAECGGVELLYTMYCDAIGWPLPSNREQKYYGVKWIHLRRDFQSAYYYWKRGELSLKEWWFSIRGRKTYALFSWTDPAPFWGDLLRVVCIYLHPKERKKRVYRNL
jgi:predicted ATP-grasp superfamily ATP-dependent carboligase